MSSVEVIRITRDERLGRVARAQELMRARGIGAMVLEPGASLLYFTGIDWYLSERLTAAVIPADGDPVIVTPAFEAPSVSETLAIPAQIRTWEEDADPHRLLAGALRNLGAHESLGIERNVRFFAANRVAGPLGNGRLVDATPIVAKCRMVKSPAEIGLMQKAADITMAAFRETWPQIKRGMTAAEIGALMNEITKRLGGRPEFALILLGEASAYPHGSAKPQEVRDGEVVLMDCGCSVEGYRSDISRTFVFGEPSLEHRKIWDQVKRGQQIAMEAARLGAPAGSIDDAVRAQYEAWGYGPGYGHPGLPHRTGHGIGLDGHEPAYLVHGDETRLSAGMCFSNEPGIYFPGRFGIRLEDCFYMTGDGPNWFSKPQCSIDQPLA